MSDQTFEPSAAARLGDAFRHRRRALGMTQHEVAELAQTTQRFVSTLENAKETVRLDKVIAIAEALGLELLPTPHDRVPQVRALLREVTGDH